MGTKKNLDFLSGKKEPIKWKNWGGEIKFNKNYNFLNRKESLLLNQRPIPTIRYNLINMASVAEKIIVNYQILTNWPIMEPWERVIIGIYIPLCYPL